MTKIRKKVGKHWFIKDTKTGSHELPIGRKKSDKKVNNLGKKIGSRKGRSVYAISDPKGLY